MARQIFRQKEGDGGAIYETTGLRKWSVGQLIEPDIFYRSPVFVGKLRAVV